MPKYEIRNNTESRKGEMSETSIREVDVSLQFGVFEPWSFELVSDFDIRISDLTPDTLLRQAPAKS